MLKRASRRSLRKVKKHSLNLFLKHVGKFETLEVNAANELVGHGTRGKRSY